MNARAIGDGELLDAVEAAIEDGETDLLEGGVHATTVADRLGIERHTARERLVQLAERGDLREVHGADPETLRGRLSFLPTGGEEP
jgi:hypothetical protein